VEDLSPELVQCLRSVVARVAEYGDLALDAPAGEAGDWLKQIYLRLVPSPLRKGLGEYYTPDWLARRLMDLLQERGGPGNPDTRLLDPACGSGTFLVLAISAARSNLIGQSLAPHDLLRKISQNIVGIDLNPLAVIAARANFLLALGPLLQHRGREALEIPVYLGDSIRIPSKGPCSRGPADLGQGDTPHPVSVPFDFVVGNPPWIGWENLPEDYRRVTKDLWHEHGLFVHRGMDTILGKGKKDLSMLMTYVAAEHYLKAGGRLGFIITQAVFKMAGAGQGFRRFLTRGQVPLCCERVEDYSALQLFEGANTKAALVVIRKGDEQTYPTPYRVFQTRKSGQKPGGCADSNMELGPEQLQVEDWQAEPSDPRDPTSAWLTGNPLIIAAVKKVLGKSDYKAHQGVNTGGANAVYWFEIVRQEPGDGIVLARNIIGAAKNRIKSETIPIERSRLYPLLRGPDVTAWQANPTAWLLLVQGLKTRRGIAETEMAKTPKAWQWLRRHSALLRNRAAYKRFFKERSDPFWSMFDVGSYTFKPWKVVWPRIASRLEAAVVSSLDGKPVLAQETFSCVGLEDEAEAFYVAGVINATPFRFAVSAFSQPGTKSFGTPGILERARIPQFDPASVLHQRISAEAKRLSGGVPEAAEKVHRDLDALCRFLWGLDQKELHTLQIRAADRNG